MMSGFFRRISAAVFVACFALSSFAAVTITSPADYATVSTMTPTFKTERLKSAFITVSTYSSKDTTARKSKSSDYKSNSVPVTLSWTGTSGQCTVTVTRANDGQTVFTETTTANSVLFYDAEIGRNYTWTVSSASGSAEGHFFTERNAPRAINYYSLASQHVDNARDMGGVTNTAGKVVKQGMIYRTRQFDWCAEPWDEELENPRYPTGVWHGIDSDGDPTEATVYVDSNGFPCMPYWRDILGIKLDLDLREIDGDDGVNSCMREYGSTLYTSPIGRSVRRFFTEHACGKPFGWNGTQGASGTGLITDSVARNTFYHAFTNFTDSANYPIVFHCAHGKDRTGFLGMVIHGLLDVPLDTIKRDYSCAFYAVSSYRMTSMAIDSYKTAFSTRYSGSAGSKLSAQIAAYITEAYTDAGRTAQEAATDIAAFKARMLEEPESPAVAPVADDSNTDTFQYADYYFRRTAGGGSWDSGQVYWFKDLNDSHNWPGGANPSAFENCYYFYPTTTKKYAFPAASKKNAGKVVANAQYAPDPFAGSDDHFVGAYGFKPVFTSSGHTNAVGVAVTDRTVWEFQYGNANFQNTDIYVSDFTGTGSIDVWAGSTFFGTDFTVTTDAKSHIYLKFPKGNCANAGVHFYYDDKAENSLGWFTGGEVGTRQRIVLDNCRFALKASGKTSQVEGALDFTFNLGDQTLTSSAAMLSSVGTIVINAGSALTVDAGQKAIGTYKLISAGTLTDNADLTSNCTISNCLAGTYGQVTRSGQTLSLVIAAEIIPQPEPTPVTAPTAVAGLVYNGSAQTGVAAGTGYTLGGTYSATDAGNYTATATLADGYVWSDNTVAAKNINWSIAKASNSWVTQPSLSPTTFETGTSVTVVNGSSAFGSVSANYTKEQIEILVPGNYTFTATVTETSNWTGLEKSVNFTVTAPAGPVKTAVALPVAVTGLFETGDPQTGVIEGTGYTLTGNTGIYAGNYAATAKLADGYCWAGGSEDDAVINWTIAAPNNHGIFRYLYTDAAGYIMTQYVPNTARTIIEIKVQYLNRVGDNSLFCANGFTGNQGKWGNPFQLLNEDDVTYQAAGVNDWIELCPFGFTDTASEHVFRACGNVLTVDGVEYVSSEQPNDGLASGPLALFAWCGKNDKYSYLGAKKVSYVKIWEIQQSGETNLVYDLVPALNTEDKATLFNKVDNTCLSAANAPGYTVGPVIPAPVIGNGHGTSVECADGTFKVRIVNAENDVVYGYRTTTDLRTPENQWEVGWFDESDFEITDGEAVLSLPLQSTDTKRFFKILAK